MENASWNDIIAAERKNLAPIMEEEDKGQAKGLSSISFLISLVSILALIYMKMQNYCDEIKTEIHLPINILSGSKICLESIFFNRI